MTHSIVIGGSKGLGQVIARQFVERGDSVSVISRNEPPHEEHSEHILYFTADLIDVAATQEALDALIKTNGAPNYLVFCQRYRGSTDSWQGEIEVSLTASKRVVEYLQDSFETRSDCGIVFVSSVFGELIGEGQPLSYHLGKAGMNQMVRYYAVNLGKKGIRTNAVSPFTYLKKESKDFYLNNKNLLDLYKEIVPLSRMGTVEDSSNVIELLCSPATAFVNGQNIYIDGGLSLVWSETIARKLKSL